MGRGRAKAKQTKVARDLKYSSAEIDVEMLSRELHSDGSDRRKEDDIDPFAEGNYIRRA